MIQAHFLPERRRDGRGASEIDRGRDRVIVYAGADVLLGGDAAVDGDRDVRGDLKDRHCRAVNTRSAGPVTPDERSAGVAIEVVLQRLSGFDKPSRAERRGGSSGEGDLHAEREQTVIGERAGRIAGCRNKDVVRPEVHAGGADRTLRGGLVGKREQRQYHEGGCTQSHSAPPGGPQRTTPSSS